MVLYQLALVDATFRKQSHTAMTGLNLHYPVKVDFVKKASFLFIKPPPPFILLKACLQVRWNFAFWIRLPNFWIRRNDNVKV